MDHSSSHPFSPKMEVHWHVTHIKTLYPSLLNHVMHFLDTKSHIMFGNTTRDYNTMSQRIESWPRKIIIDSKDTNLILYIHKDHYHIRDIVFVRGIAFQVQTFVYKGEDRYNKDEDNMYIKASTLVVSNDVSKTLSNHRYRGSKVLEIKLSPIHSHLLKNGIPIKLGNIERDVIMRHVDDGTNRGYLMFTQGQAIIKEDKLSKLSDIYIEPKDAKSPDLTTGIKFIGQDAYLLKFASIYDKKAFIDELKVILQRVKM